MNQDQSTDKYKLIEPFIPQQIAEGDRIRYSGQKLLQVPYLQVDGDSKFSVDLSDNQIKEVPDDAFANLLTLQEVNLQNNKCANVNQSLAVLKKLEIINLGYNDLTIVPFGFIELTSLTHVQLQHNKIDSLYNFAYQSKALQHLDVSHNNISEIPPAIGQLAQLQYLDVSSNKIPAFPPLLGKCKQLQVLKANSNRISYISSNLTSCSNLIELHVNSNKIFAITSKVYLWEKLKYLDVRENVITVLPASLGWLNLHTICLEGNVQLKIPQQVLQRGTVGILSYCQILGEQHRLVETHLSRFSELDQKRAVSPDQERPHERLLAGSQVPQAIQRYDSKKQPRQQVDWKDKLEQAKKSTILNLQKCCLESIPSQVQDLSNLRVVDLRQNMLKEIAQEDIQGKECVVFNASNNQLQTIASDFHLPKAAVISCQFNQIKTLWRSIGQSKCLQQLYLSNNQLQSLPECLADLPIADMFVSENRFSKFPECVLKISTLQKLSIACNDIETLPSQIGNIKQLKFLDISFNRLVTLPRSIASLTELSAFNISYNPFGEELPEEVYALKNLLEFNADHIGLTKIPSRLGELEKLHGLQLEGASFPKPYDKLYQANPLLLCAVHDNSKSSIDLSNSGISEVPPNLESALQLKTLNLANNQIRVLPTWLSQLPYLSNLDVSNNPLVDPYASVAKQNAGTDLVNALKFGAPKSLDVQGLNLNSLPTEFIEEVSRRTPLQYTSIDLSQNQFGDLPDSLGSLQNCLSCCIQRNKLHAWPKFIGDLQKVVFLDVSRNYIKSIPDEIGNLQSLQFLYAHNNSITTVSPRLFQLGSINTVVLDHNSINIVEVPDEPSSQLQHLSIVDNQLQQIPKIVAKITELQRLLISHNYIESIPKEILKLDLVHFDISDNCIQTSQIGSTLHAAGRGPVASLLEKLINDPVLIEKEFQPSMYQLNNLSRLDSLIGNSSSEISESNKIKNMQRLAAETSALRDVSAGNTAQPAKLRKQNSKVRFKLKSSSERQELQYDQSFVKQLQRSSGSAVQTKVTDEDPELTWLLANNDPQKGNYQQFTQNQPETKIQGEQRQDAISQILLKVPKEKGITQSPKSNANSDQDPNQQSSQKSTYASQILKSDNQAGSFQQQSDRLDQQASARPTQQQQDSSTALSNPPIKESTFPNTLESQVPNNQQKGQQDVDINASSNVSSQQQNMQSGNQQQSVNNAVKKQNDKDQMKQNDSTDKSDQKCLDSVNSSQQQKQYVNPNAELQPQDIVQQSQGRNYQIEGSTDQSQGGVEQRDGSEVNKYDSQVQKEGSEIKQDGSEVQKDGSGAKKDGKEVNKDSREAQRKSSKVIKDASEVNKDGSEVKKGGSEIKKDGIEVQKDASKVQKDGIEVQKDSSEVLKDGREAKKDDGEIKKDRSETKSDASEVKKDDIEVQKDTSDVLKDDSEVQKDDIEVQKDDIEVQKDSSEVQKDGSEIQKDGSEIQKDGSEIQKDGSVVQKVSSEVQKDSSEVQKDGSEVQKDGSEVQKDGSEAKKDGIEVNKDGIEVNKDGIEVNKDGIEVKKDGIEVKKDGIEVQQDGSEVKKDGIEVKKDGIEVQQDGSEIKKDSSETKQDPREVKKDDIEVQQDSSEIQKDGSEIQKDGSEIQKDGSEIQKDGSEVEKDSGDVQRESKSKVNKDASEVQKDDSSKIKKDDNEVQKEGSTAQQVANQEHFDSSMQSDPISTEAPNQSKQQTDNDYQGQNNLLQESKNDYELCQSTQVDVKGGVEQAGQGSGQTMPIAQAVSNNPSISDQQKQQTQSDPVKDMVKLPSQKFVDVVGVDIGVNQESGKGGVPTIDQDNKSTTDDLKLPEQEIKIENDRYNNSTNSVTNVKNDGVGVEFSAEGSNQIGGEDLYQNSNLIYKYNSVIDHDSRISPINSQQEQANERDSPCAKEIANSCAIDTPNTVGSSSAAENPRQSAELLSKSENGNCIDDIQHGLQQDTTQYAPSTSQEQQADTDKQEDQNNSESQQLNRIKNSSSIGQEQDEQEDAQLDGLDWLYPLKKNRVWGEGLANIKQQDSGHAGLSGNNRFRVAAKKIRRQMWLAAAQKLGVEPLQVNKTGQINADSVPAILEALGKPPAPPQASSTPRPQSTARFKRVIKSTAQVQQAIQQTVDRTTIDSTGTTLTHQHK